MNPGEELLLGTGVSGVPASLKIPDRSNNLQSFIARVPCTMGRQLHHFPSPAAVHCLHNSGTGPVVLQGYCKFSSSWSFFPSLHRKGFSLVGRSTQQQECKGACATLQRKQEGRRRSMPQVVDDESTRLSG